MYAFAVCEPRVVTVVSCVLKASCFIYRDFTVALMLLKMRNTPLAITSANQ